ncbi:MAG: acyltransferase [Lachnospiraceae bacterium]|nr:acyltransferase [Lachnospiraceae bacterium]
MLARIKKELRLLYSSKAQSNNGKRITYLDMVRGIAIFLVVVGHSGLIDFSKNIWLSTFHLPAFFLVSGILMQLKKEEEQPAGKILRHKIKSIMLPYIWFSIGSLGVDLVQILRGVFTWDMLKEHVIQTVTLQGYSVLWFLPVLLFAELFVYAILKLCRHFIKKKVIAVIVSVATVLLMAVGAFYGYHALANTGLTALWLAELRVLTKSVIAASLIGFGYLTGMLLQSIPKKDKKTKTGIVHWLSEFRIGGLLLGGCLFAINILVVPYIQLMDLNNVNIGNPLLYVGLGLTGGLGLLFICKSIPNVPLITFYGQNSLIVMCTHLNFYIMNTGMIIGRDVFVPLPGPDGLQFMVGSIVCTMLLEIPVILFIRMFLPFIIGQKYKVSNGADKKI